MDATTLLITVYCLVDEWLAGRRLRQRGLNPMLRPHPGNLRQASSDELMYWSQDRRPHQVEDPPA